MGREPRARSRIIRQLINRCWTLRWTTICRSTSSWHTNRTRVFSSKSVVATWDRLAISLHCTISFRWLTDLSRSGASLLSRRDHLRLMDQRMQLSQAMLAEVETRAMLLALVVLILLRRIRQRASSYRLKARGLWTTCYRITRNSQLWQSNRMPLEVDMTLKLACMLKKLLTSKSCWVRKWAGKFRQESVLLGNQVSCSLPTPCMVIHTSRWFLSRTRWLVIIRTCTHPSCLYKVTIMSAGRKLTNLWTLKACLWVISPSNKWTNNRWTRA